MFVILTNFRWGWRWDTFTVDDGGSWVLGLNARLVGLDVDTESTSVSNIVDDTVAAVGVSQGVGASDVSVGVARLTTRRTATGVVLIVTEFVVAYIVFTAELLRGSSSGDGGGSVSGSCDYRGGVGSGCRENGRRTHETGRAVGSSGNETNGGERQQDAKLHV